MRPSGVLCQQQKTDERRKQYEAVWPQHDDDADVHAHVHVHVSLRAKQPSAFPKRLSGH